MTTVYETQATAIGGRAGSAGSADGRLRVRLDMPKCLGGGGEGTNPEQLLAAGYAACFLSTIRRVAGREKTAIAPDSNVTATVALGPDESGEGFTLSVALAVDLPGLAIEEAARIAAAAHAVCPYSNALRGNVDVRIDVA